MIKTDYIIDGKTVSYEIDEENNGYTIYLGVDKFMEQYREYSHLFVPNGILEENCLAQIEELANPVEPEPSELDLLEAQIMYTALITDTLIESEVQ